MNADMETITVQKKTWRDYLPKYVSLYETDYRDTLDEHKDLLQQCIDENSLCALSQQIFEWWDCPEEYYMDDIEKKMRRDDMEDEFWNHKDEIQDYLYEHDESDPEKELLRNTGAFPVFYSLCECDHGWIEAPFMAPFQATSEEESAEKICKLLSIKPNTEAAKKVLDVCANSSYGGELRIYFQTDVEDLISGEEYVGAKDKDDWKSIVLKGTFMVAVYNPAEGAGDYEPIELDCELPFIRKNLKISCMEHYDIESCFGMSDDWAKDADTPVFTYDKPKRPGVIKESVTNQREQHFEEVFRAGGCSVEDDNSDRHRGVYYRNGFPAGWVCPNCGHIWYD